MITGGRQDGAFDAFLNVAQFAEVGQGNMNWPKILPAAEAAGAEFFFIEQDEPTAATSSIASPTRAPTCAPSASEVGGRLYAALGSTRSKNRRRGGPRGGMRPCLDHGRGRRWRSC